LKLVLFWGWGDWRRAKKVVGGDEKWHPIIGGFQGSFKTLVTVILA
jgi:hypothetical protein